MWTLGPFPIGKKSNKENRVDRINEQRTELWASERVQDNYGECAGVGAGADGALEVMPRALILNPALADT